MWGQWLLRKDDEDGEGGGCQKVSIFVDVIYGQHLT